MTTPTHAEPIPSLRRDDVRRRYRNDAIFAAAVKALLDIRQAAGQDSLWLHAAAVMVEDLVSNPASVAADSAEEPPIREQLKTCDHHLTAYLQSVPRRGHDLVVHVSGETVEDLRRVLDEIFHRIHEPWPIKIVSSAGWWADGEVRPWHRYVQNEAREVVAEDPKVGA